MSLPGLRVRTYAPELLPAVVEYWNAAFRDCRNFVPQTPESFRRRVIEKSNGVECFDAAGFLLAVVPGPQGERIIGLLHAGVRTEPVCRALLGDAHLGETWPGGSQGYLAIIHVDSEQRRQGVGAALWNEAQAYWTGCASLALDGQCLNPWYGNSEGPATPPWGTPEGIAVRADDAATIAFFAKRGFFPRHRALTLERSLVQPPLPDPAPLLEAASAQGVAVHVLDSARPVLGGPLDETVPYVTNEPYICVTAHQHDRALAELIVYPMALPPVAGGRRPRVAAIYELEALEEARGRGLGKACLALGLDHLVRAGFERVELLTIPEVSPAALKLYESFGFTRVVEWAIF